jgi:hypothetical protein
LGRVAGVLGKTLMIHVEAQRAWQGVGTQA